MLTPQQLLNTRMERRFYIQAGHPVRLRVNSLEWQDVRPVPVGAAKAAAAQLGRTITAGEVEGAEKTSYERAAFKVIVSTFACVCSSFSCGRCRGPARRQHAAEWKVSREGVGAGHRQCKLPNTGRRY